MKNLVKADWAIAAAAVFLLAGNAQAVPLLGVTITGGTAQGAFLSNTLGYKFEAVVDTNVVSLGIWDDQGNGLNEAHDVGLWDSSVTLLASVSVASGTGSRRD